MDIKTYKSKRIFTLTLPSGLEVTLRKLSPYYLLKYRSLAEKNDGSFEEQIFKKAFVNPKIPDDLEVEDLLPEDYLELQKLFLRQLTTEQIQKEIDKIKESDENKDFSIS